MTSKIESAARMALEALIVAEEFVDRHSEDWYISGQKDLKQIREAITALREALAEQERKAKYDERFERLEKFEQAEQKPVAYQEKMSGVLRYGKINDSDTPLYADPQPVKQEPIGKVVMESMGVGDAQIVRLRMNGRIPPVGTKLYFAPVRTKDPCHPLQDLTDDEIDALIDAWMDTAEDYPEFARAVIAAYKEKNK